MGSIDFYYMPVSPPCRAVEMVAGMVGAPLNKKYINLFNKEHLKEDFLKITPLHKVPTIVDGDLTLGESRAIMMYLVNKYKPNDSLYPQDPTARARIDEMLFYESGTLFQQIYKIFRPMLFVVVKELNADDEKSFKDSLQYLDKRLSDGGKKFMFGDNLTIADISLAAAFTFPACCGYDMNEYKNLVAYLDRMKSAIPNYKDINDEPCEMMKQVVQKTQAGN